jgi:uncharacterized protein YpuA (DUF1002 family)
MTDIVTADIKDIMFDVKQIISRIGECVVDVDRGINVNHTPKYDTSVTKQDKINSLFECLADAKYDMGSVQESLKEIKDKLDNLLDVVEYEAVAEEIR